MNRILALTVGTLFAAVLIDAMLALPPAPVDLRVSVATLLDESGVAHPVTAVLLNFRGYDTLLETAVLLLALLGLMAAGARTGATPGSPADLPLQVLARVAVPLIVLFSFYLLWAGAFRPGGAFQAGAVLAGGAVLLNLTGLQPGWTQPRALLRAGLAGGFLLFLGVAGALLANGTLLGYPAGHAGALILLIEAGLGISLALILAGLFLLLSANGGQS